MLQHGLDSTLYAVNRKGESAYSVQAYVPYYKCLCPNQEGTAEFLLNLYGKVADIPEVDYIHLDYIRYVDVILARGLWEKYGLVMTRNILRRTIVTVTNAWPISRPLPVSTSNP